MVTQQLERICETLRVHPINQRKKWDEVKIGMFLEFIKKQSFNLKQFEDGFTFYGHDFLIETGITELPWQSFEYTKTDMRYDRSFDQIMIFEGLTFLLFKDSMLIDYRYDGDRDFLMEYLKIENSVERKRMGEQYKFRNIEKLNKRVDFIKYLINDALHNDADK
jgi:hypothetical protein